MKHVSKTALLGSAALITKGDDDNLDPAELVTKALGEFKTEFEKTLDNRLSAIETKGADPELLKRLDKIEAKGNRLPSGELEKKQSAELERKAFQSYLRSGDRADQLELKTLVVSNDPQGGYLAPSEFSSEFIRDLVDISPIRAIASVRSTTAPEVIYPTRTGIGGNARWVGEIETRPKSEPTFGQAEIPVRELATFVDISNQLLADSGGSAEAEVRLALSEDFAQKETSAYVWGNGIKQPVGVMVDTAVPYFPNGHATILSADALIAMAYSLPAVYRRKGKWLMNGATIAKIRTMKDGQNNYLWQRSFAEGQPETLLGFPIVDVLDMEDVASGKFPIAFGDFEAGYRIVDRIAMSVLVNPYLLATNGITRIHAMRRTGGGVLRPQAITKLKMAVS